MGRVEYCGGLPLYQWMAMVSIFAGMSLCTVRSVSVTMPVAPPSTGLWLAALAAGLVYAFAMSVDFPESSRRFARLSG